MSYKGPHTQSALPAPVTKSNNQNWDHFGMSCHPAVCTHPFIIPESTHFFSFRNPTLYAALCLQMARTYYLAPQQTSQTVFIRLVPVCSPDLKIPQEW
jgi:hypothetical protein